MENTFGKNIIPDNDDARIAALNRYQILDMPTEDAFDRIAQLATKIFKTPISLISLVDAERVFFKANIGAGNARETSRGLSLCSLAVLSPDVLVFENAPEDPCLLASPHVAAEHGLKFYAGAPLVTPDNFQIGTLCVVDFAERKFSEGERAILKSLSEMVMHEIEIRLAANSKVIDYKTLADEAAAANKELIASNEELVSAQYSLKELNDQLEDRVAQRTNAVDAIKFRLEAMVMNTPIAMAILKGQELIVEIANQPMLTVWRRTLDQVIGYGLEEIFPELRGQPNPGRMRGVMKSGKRFSLPETEVILGTVDGELKKHYARFSYDPILEVSGTIDSILVTVIDITEEVLNRQEIQKNIEELATSKSKLDQMIAELPASIVVLTGSDLIVESTNASNLAYWQKSKEEVIGKPLLKILPELEHQPFPGQLRRVMESGETIVIKEGEVNLTLPDGTISTTWVDYSYQPITDKHGERIGVLVMSNDVSDKVNARNKIAQAEQKLQIANDDLLFTIDAAALATFDFDPQTGRFSGNELLKDWFGLQQAEEIPLAIATNVIVESNREKVISAITKALDYESRGKYDIEYAISNTKYPEPRTVHAKGKTLFNDLNQAIRLSGTIQDITEQKKDDQRKSDFIGMVSHELKTPLTSLTAIVQVTKSKLKESEDAFLAGAMEKADIQVKKMSNMINGFLNISRLESSKMQIVEQPFYLDELIKETIREHELIVTTHTIKLNLCDHVEINADRDKIGSVITNLISNAIKYSPKGKKVEVECWMSKDSVQVSIKDQGLGIKAADLPHVFDRYFRVESNHTRHISGFGIGLYLSAEIVKQHHGQIWAESKTGAGSTFYFSLPINEPRKAKFFAIA